MNVVHLPVVDDGLPVRPRTRAGCVDVPRPCPFVSCKHNGYLEVEGGDLRLYRGPHVEPNDVPADQSCVLDAADNGRMTLVEISKWQGVTRERIRQIEAVAIERVRHSSRIKLIDMFADGDVGRPEEQHGPLGMAVDDDGTGTYSRSEEQPERRGTPEKPRLLFTEEDDGGRDTAWIYYQYERGIRALEEDRKADGIREKDVLLTGQNSSMAELRASMPTDGHDESALPPVAASTPVPPTVSAATGAVVRKFERRADGLTDTQRLVRDGYASQPFAKALSKTLGLPHGTVKGAIQKLRSMGLIAPVNGQATSREQEKSQMVNGLTANQTRVRDAWWAYVKAHGAEPRLMVLTESAKMPKAARTANALAALRLKGEISEKGVYPKTRMDGSVDGANMTTIRSATPTSKVTIGTVPPVRFLVPSEDPIVEQLREKRRGLEQKIAGIDAAIAALGGKVGS